MALTLEQQQALALAKARRRRAEAEAGATAAQPAPAAAQTQPAPDDSLLSRAMPLLQSQASPAGGARVVGEGLVEDLKTRPIETAAMIGSSFIPGMQGPTLGKLAARAGLGTVFGQAGSSADVAVGLREEETPILQTAMEALLPEVAVRYLSYILPKGAVGLSRESVDEVLAANADTAAIEAEKRLFGNQEVLTAAQRSSGRVGMNQSDELANVADIMMSRNQQSYYAQLHDRVNQRLQGVVLGVGKPSGPVVDTANFQKAVSDAVLSKDPAAPGLEQILRNRANAATDALPGLTQQAQAAGKEAGTIDVSPLINGVGQIRGQLDGILGQAEADAFIANVKRSLSTFKAAPSRVYAQQLRDEAALRGAGPEGEAVFFKFVRPLYEQAYASAAKQDDLAGQFARTALESFAAKYQVFDLTTNNKAYKAIAEGGFKDLKPILRDYDKYVDFKLMLEAVRGEKQLRGAAEAIDPLDLAIRQDFFDEAMQGGRWLTANGVNRAMRAYDERVLMEHLGENAVADLRAVRDITRAMEGVGPAGTTGAGAPVAAVRGIRPGDPDKTLQAISDVAVSRVTGFVPATGMRWLLLRAPARVFGVTDRGALKNAMQSEVGKKFINMRLDDPAAYATYVQFARELGVKPLLTAEAFAQESTKLEQWQNE
ncbi:MAG: hypothetical protein ACK5NY_03500 [Burkholderiaceae bacterium]